MRERNNYSAEFKARVVLELLREEKTVSQIISETGVCATVLSRWKAEAVSRMHEIFERGESDTEKLRKEFEAKEEEYQKTIGELTMGFFIFSRNYRFSPSISVTSSPVSSLISRFNVSKMFLKARIFSAGISKKPFSFDASGLLNKSIISMNKILLDYTIYTISGTIPKVQ